MAETENDNTNDNKNYSSVSLSAVNLNSINKETDDMQSLTSNDHFIDDWGFTLDELYKMALKFYKDKEGTKALQMSYNDRLKLVALTKQISYGKFKADIAPGVGILDVIGNDRRQVWQSLGDMSQQHAMTEFVRSLIELCPQFTPYIKAHQAERDQLEKERQEEEERQKDEERKKFLENEMNKEEERLRSLKIEQQIKDALNQQTAIQFRQYAKQQVPDNIEQQEALVVQLQDQHFQQYMQQVHSQQVVHQRQQYAQMQALASGTRPPDSAAVPVIPLTAEAIESQADQQLLIQYMTEVDGRRLGKDLHQTDGSIMTELEADDHLPDANGMKDNLLENEGGGGGVQEDGDGQSDIDDNDHCNPLCEMPPLIPATIWTRKDIREFKETVRKNPENVIRVGSLSTATVRVPTHENGMSIFFEFATDSYDLGFGMYFEWTLTPPNQVTVQISESSDEEELEEEEGSNNKGDVEKGSNHKKDNGPPTDEIIQVYRRDCHDEVFCGSHTYPGRGVYLLKFDNSYSLWRSKTVYYRVFYSR